MNNKSFWRKLLKNNILITFTLVLFEFPFTPYFKFSFIFVSRKIVHNIGGMFGVNLIGDSDYEFDSIYYTALVVFIFHLIIYVAFRFAVKQKIHIPILTALLILFVICIPFMVQDFLNSPIILGTLGIWFGCMFLYQIILFGMFIVIFSMLDRYSESMMSWLKILISFVTAFVVGTLVSWCIWTLLMKLYFYLH